MNQNCYDVIFISGSHGIYGGGQVYISELNNKINSLGIKSVILASDNIFDNALHIPRVDTWKYKFKNYIRLLKILKGIDKERKAKIITNDITLSMLSFIFKVAGWKVYPLIHMSIYNTSGKSMFIRKIYPYVRCLFIRVSAEKILSVNKENDGMLGAKANYVGNFTINKIECNNINKNIDLLYVGRFDTEKQPEKFVRIVESLLSRGRCVNAVMVGDGILYEEIKRYVNYNNLSNSILLTGFLPKEDIIQFYRKSRFLVITSKTEGLPTVILDSAVYGVDFISPPLGSIPYVHKKWSVGHIVNVCDMDDYLDGLWDNINRYTSAPKLYSFAKEHSIDDFVLKFLSGISDD